MHQSLARRTLHDYDKDVVSVRPETSSKDRIRIQSAFIVSCVEDVSEFANLRAEWDALQYNNESSSVFMSWAWHHTWWSVFAKDSDKLCVLCVRLRGELIGVLPLYFRHRSWPRPTHVMFLGTGEGDADEVATEYLDMVARPGMRMAAAIAALEFLHQRDVQLRFELQHLLADSVLLSALRCRSDAWVLEELDRGVRYRIDCQHQTDPIPMDPKKLKRVNRSARALERDGGFEQRSIATLGEASQALEEVSALSDERQQQAGRANSAFSSDKFNQFHQQLLPVLYLDGSADIQRFYINGSLAAVLYCFYDGDTCHYYQSGFVQSLGNRYMPLTLAHLAELNRNRAGGRRYYDFMRGDMNSYKNDFLCEKTPMVTVLRYPNVIDRLLHDTFTMCRQAIVRLLRSMGVARRR